MSVARNRVMDAGDLVLEDATDFYAGGLAVAAMPVAYHGGIAELVPLVGECMPRGGR